MFCFLRSTPAHRFILQIQLSNQLPVVSWIHDLPSNKELYLGMSSVSFDSVEDSTSDWANCVIGVWPDIQIIHLTPLVGEADNQCDVLPTERPEMGGKKGAKLKLNVLSHWKKTILHAAATWLLEMSALYINKKGKQMCSSIGQSCIKIGGR